MQCNPVLQPCSRTTHMRAWTRPRLLPPAAPAVHLTSMHAQPLPSSPSPQVVSQGRAAAEGELVVMPNLDGVQVGFTCQTAHL